MFSLSITRALHQFPYIDSSLTSSSNESNNPAITVAETKSWLDVHEARVIKHYCIELKVFLTDLSVLVCVSELVNHHIVVPHCMWQAGPFCQGWRANWMNTDTLKFLVIVTDPATCIRLRLSNGNDHGSQHFCENYVRTVCVQEGSRYSDHWIILWYLQSSGLFCFMWCFLFKRRTQISTCLWPCFIFV